MLIPTNGGLTKVGHLLNSVAGWIHVLVERRLDMRHFMVIVAALLFLSFTAGGAFAESKGNDVNKGNKANKVELTEQEMDAVTAGAPVMMPPPFSSLPGFVIGKTYEFVLGKIAPAIPPKVALPFMLLHPGAPH
jgi:hypothetical protein